MKNIQKFCGFPAGRRGLIALAALLAIVMGPIRKTTAQAPPQGGGPVVVVAQNLMGNPFVPGTFSFDIQMVGHSGAPAIAYAFMASYDRRYVELIDVVDVGLGGQPPEMGPPGGEGPRGWRVLATLGNFHNEVLDPVLVRLVFQVHSMPPPNYLVSVGPDPVNVPLVDKEFRSIPHRYDNSMLVQAGLIPAQNQDYFPTPTPDLDPDLDGGGFYDEDGQPIAGAPGSGGDTEQSPVERMTEHMRGMRERYFHSDVVVDERGVTRFADGRDQNDRDGSDGRGGDSDDDEDPLERWARQQERTMAGVSRDGSPLTAELIGSTRTQTVDQSTTGAVGLTTATATADGTSTDTAATTSTAAATTQTLPQTITIQGRVKTVQGRLLEDVSIVTDQGRLGAPSATTGADGAYTLTVPRGWSGQITAVFPNYQLSPGSMDFENLTEDQVDQNFTAERFSDDLTRYYNIVYRRNDKPTTSGLIFTHAGIRIMNGRSSDTITIALRDEHRGKAVPPIRELVSDAGMERIHTETAINAIRVGGKLGRITSKRGEIQTIRADEVGTVRLWMRRVNPRRQDEYQLPSVAIATSTEDSANKMRIRNVGLELARIESKQPVVRHSVVQNADHQPDATPEKPDATEPQGEG